MKKPTFEFLLFLLFLHNQGPIHFTLKNTWYDPNKQKKPPPNTIHMFRGSGNSKEKGGTPEKFFLYLFLKTVPDLWLQTFIEIPSSGSGLFGTTSSCAQVESEGFFNSYWASRYQRWHKANHVFSLSYWKWMPRGVDSLLAAPIFLQKKLSQLWGRTFWSVFG